MKLRWGCSLCGKVAISPSYKSREPSFTAGSEPGEKQCAGAGDIAMELGKQNSEPSIDVKGADGERHASFISVNFYCHGGRSLMMGLQAIPAGDHIARGELFDDKCPVVGGCRGC